MDQDAERLVMAEDFTELRGCSGKNFEGRAVYDYRVYRTFGYAGFLHDAIYEIGYKDWSPASW